MPALRALRRALPEHELVLATPSVLAPLVRLADATDRLLPASGLEPLRRDITRPQVAVNLHGSGPQSHRLLLDLDPERLLAFACPRLGVDGPAWQADEHEVVRWSRLVEETLSVSTDRSDLLLAVPSRSAAIDGAVVVHPGAAYPSRRWPPDRFAAVARWAHEQGFPVVITGSAGEVALAEEVRRTAGLSRETVLAGRTDLEELAAVVAAARLVICGDTGTAHLASAYRTPSVVLFGPTPPSRWGPPVDGPHAVIWHGDGAGNPFADSPDPALLQVTVEEVTERASAMTRAPARAARRTTPVSG